jgi:hypothetical protein
LAKGGRVELFLAGTGCGSRPVFVAELIAVVGSELWLDPIREGPALLQIGRQLSAPAASLAKPPRPHRANEENQPPFLFTLHKVNQEILGYGPEKTGSQNQNFS